MIGRSSIASFATIYFPPRTARALTYCRCSSKIERQACSDAPTAPVTETPFKLSFWTNCLESRLASFAIIPSYRNASLSQRPCGPNDEAGPACTSHKCDDSTWSSCGALDFRPRTNEVSTLCGKFVQVGQTLYAPSPAWQPRIVNWKWTRVNAEIERKRVYAESLHIPLGHQKV
jgi:hypothetical protein